MSTGLTELELPARFGRYSLVSLLGEGGMAVVYRAVLQGPAGFKKDVAIKVARAAERSPWSVPGLYTEGCIGGRLRHRHIVDVYEIGDVDGRPYIAMELVEGLSLSALVRAWPKRPASVNCTIALAMARGLSAAHELRDGDRLMELIHRDLKPSNILVAWDGGVKIADFGISTWSEVDGGPGEPKRRWGTPAYMSPEQFRADKVDARSDIFSLGVVLGELALGLGRGHRRGTSEMHPWGEPHGPDLQAIDQVVPGLGAVVHRCVQHRPEDRYADARELVSSLEDVRARVPSQQDLATWMEERRARADERTETTAREGAFVPLAVRPATVLGRNRSPLPHIGDTFVGRTSDLGTLEGSSACLTTLVGPGGVGKTRLALEYARVQQSSGSVWFCDLTAARSLEGVLAACNPLLRVRLDAVETEARVHELGFALDALGPGLWIWDNLEQVVEVMAELIASLMSLAPQLRFLCTSREPLRLRGERVQRVEPLSDGDAEMLFRSRARACLGETPSSRQDLSTVARHCEGIPLALELAAGRTGAMSIAQLAERLPSSMTLLRSRNRDRPSRHRTLQLNLDWSWDLLEPWERDALAQLSVFRGGFRLESAETVVSLHNTPDAPWMVEVIEVLLDKSMLRSRETEDEPRFSMLAVVGAHAGERLSAAGPSAEARVRRAHLHHFAALGGDDVLAQLDEIGEMGGGHRLQEERGNLKEAHAFAVASEDSEAGVRCALAISHIAIERGPIHEAITSLSSVLPLAVATGLRVRLLLKRASALTLGGRTGDAMQDLEQALALTTTSSHPRWRGEILREVGRARIHDAEYEGAMRALEESMDCLARAGDIRGQGLTLRRIAIVHFERRDWLKGESVARRALEFSREVGARRDESLHLGTLAGLLLGQGRLPEAGVLFAAQAEIIESRGGNIGANLSNQGVIHQLQGNQREALEFFRRAKPHLQRLGLHEDEAINHFNGGISALEMGDLDSAYASYVEARSLYRQVRKSDLEEQTLVMLAVLSDLRGEWEQTQRHIEEAVAVKGGSVADRSLPLRYVLALVHVRAGRTDAARAVFGDMPVPRLSNLPLASGLHLYLLCARIYVEVALGRPDHARAALEGARAVASKSSAPYVPRLLAAAASVSGL